MTNMLKLMQAAKSMQKNVEETQKKLQNTTITGSDNYVTIKTDGQHFCKEVTLAAEVKDLSLPELEQAILNAINQTNEQIKNLSKSEFSQIANLMASEAEDNK